MVETVLYSAFYNRQSTFYQASHPQGRTLCARRLIPYSRMKYYTKPAMRDDASIVPYKLFLCTINPTDKIDLAEV